MKCPTSSSQSIMGRVQALCSLLQSLLIGPQSNVDIALAPDKLHPLICTCFLFCYVWCLGGNLVEKSMDAFDSFCRELFSETQDVKVNTAACPVIFNSPTFPPLSLLIVCMCMCICSCLEQVTCTATMLIVRLADLRTGRKSSLHSHTIQRYVCILTQFG